MDISLRNVRVVVGSIGDDIHVVGITILGHALRNAGAEVIQLGIQTPPAEFVASAVAEDVDVVLVSSSNGHAGFWCETLRADLDAAGAAEVLLYIGGNLAVSAATAWEVVESKFQAMGFNRVFGPRTQPADAIRAIDEDLRAADPDTDSREARRA